jgi:general secretion pathway protein C
MLLRRADRLPTLLAAMLLLAALALLGLVLAYWTWTWFGPRPELRLETDAPVSNMASAYALFGVAQHNPVTPATIGLAVDLLGVIAAERNGQGYALVRLDKKKTLVVRAGEDLSPGIRLAEVFPGHVVVQRNGISETVLLPQKHPPALPDSPGPGP